jgi:valyl-tRNA synthetase
MLQSAIERVRSLRGDFEVPHSATVDVQIVAENGELFLEHLAQVKALTKANVSVHAIGEPRPRGFAATPGTGCEVRVNMRGLVTPESLTDRIEREQKRIAKEKSSLEGRLGNPSFVSRAPADEVEKVRLRIDELARASAIIEAGRSLIGELIVDEHA